MDDRPQIEATDLQLISFLPVLIYYSIRQRAGLTDSSPLGLIRMLENELSPPTDPSAFITEFLKINLHKLFDFYFGNASQPDFSLLDTHLQQGLDLLLLHSVSDPRIESLRRLLNKFCDAIAQSPLRSQDSPIARQLLQARARTLQEMLG